MSEFKAKSNLDVTLRINKETLSFYNNASNTYDGYRSGANLILKEYYAPLLTAYTTTLAAELAQVRKERDSANELLKRAAKEAGGINNA